jgi:hypothetical protein
MVNQLEAVYEGEVEVVPDNCLEPIRCTLINVVTREPLPDQGVSVFDLEVKYRIRDLREGDTLRFIKRQMGMCGRYQKVAK